MAERLELPTLPVPMNRDSFVVGHAVAGAIPLAIWALGVGPSAAALLPALAGVVWAGRRRSAEPLLITQEAVAHGTRRVARRGLEVEVRPWMHNGVGSFVRLRSGRAELRIGALGAPIDLTLWRAATTALPDVVVAPHDLRRLLVTLGTRVDDAEDDPSDAAGPYRESDAANRSRRIGLVVPRGWALGDFFPMTSVALTSFALHGQASLFDLWVLGGAAVAYVVHAFEAVRGQDRPFLILTARGTAATMHDGTAPLRDFRRGAVLGHRHGQPALQLEVDGRTCCLVRTGRAARGAPAIHHGPSPFFIAEEDFEWLVDRLELRPRAALPPTRVDERIEEPNEQASEDSPATDPPARAVARRQSQ